MSTRHELNNGTWAYLGLIDDMVAKYTWHDLTVDEQYFDQTLRKCALFQDPLLINDGYLLHYPWARRQLTDNKSLLSKLIQGKRVFIYSKRSDGRIDKMIEELRDIVPSYGEIYYHESWSKSINGETPVQNQFEEASKGIDYHYVQWPSLENFSSAAGFDRLIDEIEGGGIENTILAQVPAQLLRQALSLYRKERLNDEAEVSKDRSKRASGPRSVWEHRVVKHLVPEKDVANRNLLMWFANEIYHYNLSLAAAGGGEDGVPITVSTIGEGQTCARFLQSGDPIGSPNLDLPPEILLLPPDDFVQLVHETSGLRKNYRTSIRAHLKSSNEGNVKDCTAEYVEAIGSWYRKYQLTNANSTRLALARNTISAGGGSALSLMFDLGMAAAVGLAIGGALLANAFHWYGIAAWRGLRLKEKLESSIASPVAKTGTFEVSTEEARKHLAESGPKTSD